MRITDENIRELKEVVKCGNGGFAIDVPVFADVTLNPELVEKS